MKKAVQMKLRIMTIVVLCYLRWNYLVNRAIDVREIGNVETSARLLCECIRIVQN